MYTNFNHFLLPARRYASAGYSDRNVSVRLSVRPSRAGIVSKRRKIAALFLHLLVAPSDAKFHHQILRGSLRTGASKKGRSVKIQRFFSFKHQYLENGSRYGQSYY